MNAEQLEKSALAMIEAFKSAEEGILRFDVKSAGAIGEVMKTLGVDGAVKAVAAGEAAAEKAATEKAATEAAEKAAADKKKAEEDEEEAAAAKKKKAEEGKDDDEDKDKLPEAFKSLAETVKALAGKVDTLVAAKSTEVEKTEAEKTEAEKAEVEKAAKKDPPASKQATGTEVKKSAPRKMGDGIFTNLFESKT